MTEEHKQKIKEGRERAKLLKITQSSDNSAVEALSKKLDSLSDIVISLSERVMASQIKKVDQTQSAPPPPQEVKISNMIPDSWREVVTKYLGNDFTLDVINSCGDFVIRIWIPEEYDRRVGDKTGRDHSSGMVRRSSDVADVIYWCKLVRANLAKQFERFKSIV